MWGRRMLFRLYVIHFYLLFTLQVYKKKAVSIAYEASKQT